MDILEQWNNMEKPYKTLVYFIKKLAGEDGGITYDELTHKFLQNVEEDYKGNGRAINKYLPTAKKRTLLKEDDYYPGTVRIVYAGSKAKELINAIPDVIETWAEENSFK